MLLLAVPLSVFAQTDSTLLHFFEQNKTDMELFSEETLKEFKQFSEENQKALQAYKDDIEKIWGKNTKLELHDRTHYVEYSDDLTSRMVIDFDKGIISLEVITNDMKKQQQEIQNAINELFHTSGKTIVKEDVPVKIQSKEILENQILDYNQSVVKKTVVKVKGKNNQVNTVTKLEIALAPEHIQKRANLYLNLVQKYSEKYKLEPELVLAMMHTESYFNPMAKSWANAYGLMQLVPKYGGRAAYKFVTGQDKIPTPQYLYVPENNIELGCAYIFMLHNHVFQDVTNPQSREYCVVSSYNCGAGNLAYAFVGSKKLHQAIPKINALTSAKVYSHMRQKLPQETREYLKVVMERKELYKSWQK